MPEFFYLQDVKMAVSEVFQCLSSISSIVWDVSEGSKTQKNKVVTQKPGEEETLAGADPEDHYEEKKDPFKDVQERLNFSNAVQDLKILKNSLKKKEVSALSLGTNVAYVGYNDGSITSYNITVPILSSGELNDD